MASPRIEASSLGASCCYSRRFPWDSRHCWRRLIFRNQIQTDFGPSTLPLLTSPVEIKYHFAQNTASLGLSCSPATIQSRLFPECAFSFMRTSSVGALCPFSYFESCV